MLKTEDGTKLSLPVGNNFLAIDVTPTCDRLENEYEYLKREHLTKVTGEVTHHYEEVKKQ